MSFHLIDSCGQPSLALFLDLTGLTSLALEFLQRPCTRLFSACFSLASICLIAVFLSRVGLHTWLCNVSLAPHACPLTPKSAYDRRADVGSSSHPHFRAFCEGFVVVAHVFCGGATLDVNAYDLGLMQLAFVVPLNTAILIPDPSLQRRRQADSSH